MMIDCVVIITIVITIVGIADCFCHLIVTTHRYQSYLSPLSCCIGACSFESDVEPAHHRPKSDVESFELFDDQNFEGIGCGSAIRKNPPIHECWAIRLLHLLLFFEIHHKSDSLA